MSNRNLSEYWTKFFCNADISDPEAAIYVQKFTENCIKPTALRQLNENHLEKLGITILGDQLSILEQARRDISKEEEALPGSLKDVHNTSKSSSDDDTPKKKKTKTDKNDKLEKTVENPSKTVQNLCATVKTLLSDVQFLKSITAFIYIGEAAAIVQDFIQSIECNPNKVQTFKKECHLNDTNLKELVNQTQKYLKARDQICHVNNKKIELFDVEELKKCYNVLGLNKTQICHGFDVVRLYILTHRTWTALNLAQS